jgi:mannose-6-phosphate isomerase
LSVQVHPSAADPSADPAEYKNECWHVLDAAPGAVIHAGIVPEFASRAALEELAGRDPEAFGSALVRHSPRAGETLNIPAGLVHTIGAGALVYEVQQSSNTTYRLYDWGRVGPDGRPRPMHLEAALRSIDYSLPPPAFMAPTPEPGGGAVCVATPFFTMREFRDAAARRPSGASFEALFVKSGTWRVESGGAAETLAPGDSLLVPADCPGYLAAPASPDAALLITTL